MKHLALHLFVALLAFSFGITIFQIWETVISRTHSSTAPVENIASSKLEPMQTKNATANTSPSSDGQIFQGEGYALKSELDATGFRRSYIKRDRDKDWILFYIDERAIFTILGHRKQLVLINDYEASKSCKVMMADLALHKTKQIDSLAMKMYRRNVHPDDRLFVNPNANGFSPDDRQVLIKMELWDVSASTAEESEQASKTYRLWWYAVDSTSGRVLHEYRTNSIPERWWIH